MQVLVVDDDEHIRVALRRCLALAGYETILCATGEEAMQTLQRSTPDAAVLDWMLPDLDGIEICRRLRAAGEQLPVLMLTARSELGDRVAGLDAGADDYLAKPFELEELLARLRALLRRTGPPNPADGSRPGEPDTLAFADLVLDRAAYCARRGERTFLLTRTEFTLLDLLLRNAGRVLERQQIMQEVWQYDFGGSGANLDVYIGYLRRKLEAGGEPRLLHTIRGVGYVIRPPGAQ